MKYEKKEIIKKYKKTFIALCNAFDKIDRLNDRIDQLEGKLETYAQLLEKNKINVKLTEEEKEKFSICLWFLNKKMKSRKLMKFWRRLKNFFTERGHSTIENY